METFTFLFLLLHVALVLIIVMAVVILKTRHKSQLHNAFLSYLFFLFIWCFGLLLGRYLYILYGYTGKLSMYIGYFGVCYLPVSILLTGIIFARTKISFTLRYKLLFVPPTIMYLALLTNDYHKLFYIQYSFFESEIVYGKLFIVHTVYSYICIIIGLYYLLYFSVKNSGFFSRQSILIFLGSIVPFIVNILVTVKVLILNAYITPITFSFAITCYMFATFKYNFLNLAPIALQRVVDLISDSFVVINEKMKIVDYNKTFVDTFSSIYKVKRNDMLLDVLNSNTSVNFDINEFLGVLDECRKQKRSIAFERHIKTDNFDKYFMVEITPITERDIFIGTIILLKDITQSKKDLETIKENQAILMEQERLASLGQLIGGIAHNLKTPIMSLSGGIEALKDLVMEYDRSIEDKSVTAEDHHEIAAEMLQWLDKMKPYCTYMSDIISTVKGQAVQFNISTDTSFTIDELIKRVDLLMKHELKRYHCVMRIQSSVDMNTELKGDVNSLVQIFDNLIINAIHAYEGKEGDIDLIIKKDDNNIVFILRDYGIGIKPEIRDRLFKEMITTKGKNGTGLGLYMSYANIKGRFGGNMWFESELGKGTTFYITIPYVKDAESTVFQGVAE